MRSSLSNVPVSPRGNSFVEDLRFRNGGGRVIANNGEINANNKDDLIHLIDDFYQRGQQGQVYLSASEAQEQETFKNSSKELLQAALTSTEEFAALGNTLADVIQVTANRDGFMRRFLNQQPLEQGQIPRSRMDMKAPTAAYATSADTVRTQIIPDHTVYPPEFFVNSRVYVDRRDIAQSIPDLLEETYSNALQATMVREDAVWKQLADLIRGTPNENLNISGPVLPSHVAELTTYLSRWGVPPAFLLMSNNLWADVISNAAWSAVYDPVSKYEVLRTGRIGTIYGLEMLSDQFRHAEHKVLENGDVYVVSENAYHGAYTDRGGVESFVIGPEAENVNGRGWHLTELLSMVIINARSVAHATRS